MYSTGMLYLDVPVMVFVFTISICRTGQLTGHIMPVECGVAEGGCLRYRGRGWGGGCGGGGGLFGVRERGAGGQGVGCFSLICLCVLAAYISQVETAVVPT